MITVATGLYPPDIGGPATYVRMLEEELPAQGVDIRVVPFGAVRHLPKLIRHLSYLAALLRAAKGTKAIYALDSISVGLPACLASFILHKPFLVRLGGDYAWEQGTQRFGLRTNLDEYTKDPHKAPLKVRLLAALQSFVVKRARLVIAPSEYLKSIIVSWAVNSEKIHVIYSALHSLKVDISQTEAREELGYKGRVIVSSGRLVPWKGFDGLLDAFAALKKEMGDLSLVIIGEGPERENLERKIRMGGYGDSVRLIGKMDKQALGTAIKASDVFVLNTAYEGLSHQLLEVMELGVPVVTTNVGGNPELITNEVSGLLVPFDDIEALKQSIKRLLENESLRTRVMQTARVRSKEFAQEAVIMKLVTLLRTI